MLAVILINGFTTTAMKWQNKHEEGEKEGEKERVENKAGRRKKEGGNKGGRKKGEDKKKNEGKKRMLHRESNPDLLRGRSYPLMVELFLQACVAPTINTTSLNCQELRVALLAALALPILTLMF